MKSSVIVEFFFPSKFNLHWHHQVNLSNIFFKYCTGSSRSTRVLHQRTGEKILPWFPGKSCNNYYDVFSGLQTDSSLHSRRIEALVRVYTNFLVIFTLSWNYNTFIFVQLHVLEMQVKQFAEMFSVIL